VTGRLSFDTSPSAERIQVELWRDMSALEKACAVSEVTRAAQELALTGIRQRYPAASEHEVFLRLAILKLGSALACRVYPDASRLVNL
jgi:hypothetical protein